MRQQHPEWLWHVFPFLFPAMWLVVSVILSLFGGWWSLARAYPPLQEFIGERFRWKSGRLGSVSYSGCLNLAANGDGLRVAVTFLFRLAHPPFLVPWPEVEAISGRRLFSRVIQLRFRKVPIANLEVSRKLAERIAAASNGAFVVPPEAA